MDPTCRLPVEVIDNIFCFVYPHGLIPSLYVIDSPDRYNIPDLTSYCLVSSAFRRVVLRSLCRTTTLRLPTTTEDAALMRCWLWRSSAKPAEHVRHLEIVLTDAINACLGEIAALSFSRLETVCLESTFRGITLDRTALEALGRSLPPARLRNLQVHGGFEQVAAFIPHFKNNPGIRALALGSVTAPLSHDLAVHLTSITRIILDDCSLSDPSFLFFLEALPSLERLEFSSCIITPSALPDLLPPRCKTLCYSPQDHLNLQNDAVDSSIQNDIKSFSKYTGLRCFAMNLGHLRHDDWLRTFGYLPPGLTSLRVCLSGESARRSLEALVTYLSNPDALPRLKHLVFPVGLNTRVDDTIRAAFKSIGQHRGVTVACEEEKAIWD